MAGVDYVSCEECGKRLAYDGDFNFREQLTIYKVTEGVICDHCVSKLKKKIETLKKHDRRKH